MQAIEDTLVKKIQNREGNEARYRRDIGLISALGIIDFIPISLYQLGIINHLPDVPGDLFDSDKVNASNEAKIAAMPDGPVSLLMYASNLLLVGISLKRKKKRNLYDYLLAANSLGQAAGGAFYLYNMIKVQKKICIYCTTGALLNFAMLVPLRNLFK